jgi:hypothetical protein
MRDRFQLSRSTLPGAVLGVMILFACGSAKASFLDDGSELGTAISQLRSAIGAHPRILKIEVDAKAVLIEAQDPRNRAHVDRWQYSDRVLGIIPMRRVSGPEPVDLQLLDPDLEANLFDLDAVDFSSLAKLEKAAIARTRIEDTALVTHMEIARRVTILPHPKAGDIRWSLRIASSREHADVFASAQGVIIGADLAGTQRAKTLDLFNELELVANAAAEFRAVLGGGPVLTAVGIDAKTVSFATNMRDGTLGKLMPGMPATASFTWDLDGLVRRLGTIDVSAQMGTPRPSPFAIDDVDWTILARLETSALATLAMPKARVTHLHIEKSSEGPGGPVLAWTVEITGQDDEVTSVIADTKGAILRVVLPERLRPKIDWRDPAALAGAVSRIGKIFGQDTGIASIVADERGGRITIDDKANGGRPATFELSGDGVTRAAISFSLDSMGPRFSVADLAPLTEGKFATLEAQALKKLGESRKVYLESISIGPQLFVPKAGARAIEIRVRDVAEDSVGANYAWIVFGFDGRVLDSVTY